MNRPRTSSEVLEDNNNFRDEEYRNNVQTVRELLYPQAHLFSKYTAEQRKVINETHFRLSSYGLTWEDLKL